MKNRFKFFFLTAFFLVFSISQAQKKVSDFPVLKGSYFGQKPPGMTPEVFAPGILSTEDKYDEADPVFSSDFTILFYTLRIRPREYGTMFMKQENSQWTKPYGPFYIGKNKIRYPVLSIDGKKLFYVVIQTLKKDGKDVNDSDIWSTEIISPGKWTKPSSLGPIVNTNKHERHPSVTAMGTLYFYSDRDGGKGGADIYRSRYVGGKYTAPENIGYPVNSEFQEFNPFIASDESFIMFNSSNRPDTFGSSDLYISFRKHDDSWTKVINMGRPINSSASEFKASVSPDGKYLFFSSSKSGNGDIYWVDVKIIEELKPDELK